MFWSQKVMLLGHAWKLLCLKDMPHVIVDVIIDDSSSTMDFNVAKIAPSTRIVKKSSTLSLRVAGPSEL